MNQVAVGDTVFHVLKRSNGRVPIFHTDKDLEYVRHSITKGTPYGDDDWVGGWWRNMILPVS